MNKKNLKDKLVAAGPESSDLPEDKQHRSPVDKMVRRGSGLNKQPDRKDDNGTDSHDSS